MKTAVSVSAGFFSLFAIGYVLRLAASLVAEFDEGSIELLALHFGFDLIAAAVAGAAATHVAKPLHKPESTGFTGFLFMFLFMAMFFVSDGPTAAVWLARLPLLPICAWLGERLYADARQAR
ncbi:MAG: hypothetical protein JNK48_31110 [Bryobacterales bacterium]|nr:hypothetical protein [Bryobacterales bacterium]